MAVSAAALRGTRRPRAAGAPVLAQVMAELRTNARARLGLAAILGIALLYGLILLDERAGTLQARRWNDGPSAAALRASLAGGRWSERAEEAAALRRRLEERLWQAGSEGLALASFQDWVAAAARDSGLTPTLARVEVGAPPTPGGPKPLSIVVNFVFAPDSLLAFLDRLAAADRLVVVERLRVTPQPLPSAEMMLVTYLRGTEGTPR